MGKKKSNLGKIYDRLEIAVKHFEFEKEKLATEIFQLANLQSYYGKKNKEGGIDVMIVKRTKNFLPQLDLNWLLTGEGTIETSAFDQVNENKLEYKSSSTDSITRIERKIDKLIKHLKVE